MQEHASRKSDTKYDALVVLAGGINSQGKIPPFVQERIDAAVSISKGSVPIIMTGHWSFLLSYTPPQSEASVMKAYALSQSSSIIPDKIVVEEESADTIGNAYFTKVRILEPNNWWNILLITSDFHMTRAIYIFRKVLGPDYRITSHVTPSGFSSKELKAKAVLEDKLLTFTKGWLGHIRDGDSDAIRQAMDLFPVYGSTPKYTQEDLLRLLDVGLPVIDAYGIADS
jgi:uncharacterized SAM-binding protein YcdF (DUF218 family)